jgi:hypothetical protein
MAPRRAIVKAGPMRLGSALADSGGNAGAGSAARTAPNRVPIVSTGRCRTRASAAVTMSATNGLGMHRLSRGQPTMITRATPATSTAQGLKDWKCPAMACHFPMKSAGTVPILRPRKSFIWLENDEERDPARESDRHGIGDELDRAPQPREPEPDEDQAGHQGGDGEAVHSVPLHDGIHDHHEGAGRPADLDAGTAQRRNEKARNDRRVESALGGNAAGDGKGDGERQRHDADDHPRAHIGEELLAGVAAERGDELRDERVQPSPPAVRPGGNLRRGPVRA